MSLLPDVATAGLYGLVVFLITLGGLVVFVETVRVARLISVFVLVLALAIALAIIDEFGVALLVLGFGAAFLANHIFEWLTTR